MKKLLLKLNFATLAILGMMGGYAQVIDRYDLYSVEEQAGANSIIIVPEAAPRPAHVSIMGYEPSLHWIDHFPSEGNLIELDDHSRWIFDFNDAHIIRYWQPSDQIVISPKENCYLWGSNFDYVLTNQGTGTSVNVNPYLGPVEGGVRTTWIEGIDFNNGRVYLKNGEGVSSVWEISNNDIDLFEDWRPGNALIIGVNNSWLWWFSSFNFIIINVNHNHYVRARMILPAPR